MKTDQWPDVRGHFQLDPAYLHFGAFWLSSYPDIVRRTIDRFRREIDCNPVFYIQDNEERLEAATRRAIAAFVNGDAERTVLTGSTTEGLALGIGMAKIGAADEILTTVHEHYSAHCAVEQLRARTGARVSAVELYDRPERADKAVMIAALLAGISEATRLVVLTWVHSGTGVRIPLAEMAAAIAALNAGRPANERILLCVDATHGFGVFDVDLDAVPCDIFVSSCHKWLNGPHGTGFVHFSTAAIARTEPLTPSFAPGPLGRFTGRPPADERPWERLTPGGFHAFEHRWSVPAAIGFAESIGQLRIEAHIGDLALRLKHGMASLPGLRLITPCDRDVAAGIICFEIEGLAPEQVVAGLRERYVVGSVSPYRVRYARLTPGIYNIAQEVDQVLDRLGDLATSVKTGRF